jgi:hypothetical protein
MTRIDNQFSSAYVIIILKIILTQRCLKSSFRRSTVTAVPVLFGSGQANDKKTVMRGFKEVHEIVRWLVKTVVKNAKKGRKTVEKKVDADWKIADK